MFAGAAREAVFANPDVIRRVNADFVPVALKAGLINNPPHDEEGRLYREIVRSKVAPQGICAVNSAGKVLAWTLMFDDDKSVLGFLDHASKRFAEYPDAKKPLVAERYMKYPSNKMEDVEDNGKILPVPEHHAAGTHCPGAPPTRKGTVLARLFGRALDKDGKPVTDTLRQEHYVEDRFHVPVAMQQDLAKSLADAGANRFRLSNGLARLLVNHAYLGQLDVNPVSAPGAKGDLKQAEFWAQKIVGADDDPVRIRIEGESEAVGGPNDEGQRTDGRRWEHDVKLTWQGIVEMKKDRMSRLLLMARGSEKLKWGNNALDLKGQGDVTRLPAGHAIDLRCGVRYGIIGEPVVAEEGSADGTAAGEGAGQPGQDIPDEARKQVVEALGGSTFIVFRDKAQEELKLSDEQKLKLLQKFPDFVQETMKIFEKIQDLKPEEKDKEMQEHRKKSEEKLSAVLKDVLQTKQQERLFQLQLQQAGVFALMGDNEAFKKLMITDEQRKKFMAVVQEMHKLIEPLAKEAQSGGKPEEIRPKALKIRKDHEGKIDASLSDAQKKQWREMLGKPFDLGD